jgi:hypothetical protein
VLGLRKFGDVVAGIHQGHQHSATGERDRGRNQSFGFSVFLRAADRAMPQFR